MVWDLEIVATGPSKPNRIQVAIEIGAMVGHGDYSYRIAQIRDFKIIVGI
jgi:putative transposase